MKVKTPVRMQRKLVGILKTKGLPPHMRDWCLDNMVETFDGCVKTMDKEIGVYNPEKNGLH